MPTPDASADHLFDAWGGDDRRSALENATQAAVDLVLRGGRGALNVHGCGEDPQLGEGHFVCSYTYEGGAVNFQVRGDDTDVPVVLGPRIMPGYLNYLEHVVEPGETLWSIATLYYGSGNLYYRLVSANPHTIPNPNLIHPGDIVRVPRD